MYRCIAIVRTSASIEDERLFRSAADALAHHTPGWEIAFEGRHAFAAHTGAQRGRNEAHMLSANRGVVLGTLFSKTDLGNATHTAPRFSDDETLQIVKTGGQYLTEHYWGSYFTIVHDEMRDRHYAFRDPTGNLPCYHATLKGVSVFFSHLEDCARWLPIDFSVNRTFLAQWLLFSGVRSRNCALAGVQDMIGGECLTLAQGKITRSWIWNPAQLAQTVLTEQPLEAEKKLRTTVQRVTNAWASCYDKITLKLSGGLDSSIIAGCLSCSPTQPRVNYLNIVIDTAPAEQRFYLPNVDRRTAEKVKAMVSRGDERYFARLVAERWKNALTEKPRQVSMDLRRMGEAPLLANPSLFHTAMDVDDMEIELAQTLGTQAFFSGQAGDAVLLSTFQPFSALDFAYLHGFKSGLWTHIAATSRLSRDSLWSVLGKVVKHSFLGRPYPVRGSFLKQRTLLTHDTIAGLKETDFYSPWSSLSSQLPPGKQDHVSGLAGSAYYNFIFNGGRHAAHVDPLNAQPVWELMLQIPTYIMLLGGISRGLARRAFSDVLPAEIRRRETKGAGSSFYQQVVQRNKAYLQEQLMDGRLVQHGFLDREQLEAYFQLDEPFIAVAASQVLAYLAAEIWMQRCASYQSPAAVVPSTGTVLQAV